MSDSWQFLNEMETVDRYIDSRNRDDEIHIPINHPFDCDECAAALCCERGG